MLDGEHAHKLRVWCKKNPSITRCTAGSHSARSKCGRQGRWRAHSSMSCSPVTASREIVLSARSAANESARTNIGEMQSVPLQFICLHLQSVVTGVTAVRIREHSMLGSTPKHPPAPGTCQPISSMEDIQRTAAHRRELHRTPRDQPAARQSAQ